MAYTTIDDPETYFQTVSWTGNATARSITLPGTNDMQPALVWVKERSAVEGSKIYDAARGATNLIQSTAANLEQDQDTSLTSFDSDGFSLGIDTGEIVNDDGIVTGAWCWKGGTTGSGNTLQGTSSSKAYSFDVSDASGFGITRYLGNGTDYHRIPHNQTVAPTLNFVKNRDANEDWKVYSRKLTTSNYYLTLNGTAAQTESGTSAYFYSWHDDTYFGLGSDADVNANDVNYVSYAFRDIKGYQRISTYTGNGNADGTFVWTGFRPKLVLTKLISGTANWVMKTDNFGDTYNPQTEFLYASNTAAEGDGSHMDFLSNGFKWRDSEANNNSSGGTYLYLAIAAAPFVNSNGVPGTAR